MNKKTKLIIIGIIIVGILAIGGKIYIDYQDEKREFLSAIEQDKKEIKEIARWNLKDVKTVTFDSISTDDSGLAVSRWDKSITIAPSGSMDINWYVNGGKSDRLQFSNQILRYESYNIDEDGRNIVDDDNLSLFKISDINAQIRQLLINKYAEINKKNAKYMPNYPLILGNSDIKKLKKMGFDSHIITAEIVKYLAVKYNVDIK